MERTPLEAPSTLHDTVIGVYELLFDGRLEPGELQLFDLDSPYVEAEIEFPYLGVNRTKWADWSAERRLEVLLHEFAHIEEGPDEPDHGPAFYDRLAALTAVAATKGTELESLFGGRLDFDEVRRHIVDSVNEYTVEDGPAAVEEHRRVLRETFGAADGVDTPG